MEGFLLQFLTETLFFHFPLIGFTTQEIPAIFGSDMKVTMALEVTQISEVVVVGYGVQKKESIVRAITQVNNKYPCKIWYHYSY